MRALRFWLVALLCAAPLALLGDPRSFARHHGAIQRLSIASGGTGGVWYPYGGGIARIISAHIPGVEATAEVTAASVDNLRYLRAGTADIAFTMADVADEARRGVGPFASGGPVPVFTLAVLYTNVVQLVTVTGRGVSTVDDLRGKVISTGAPGSGTETVALRMLVAAGLDPARDVRRQSLGAAQSVDGLRDGKLDAFFWAGGVPTGALLDLANTPGVRMSMVPLDQLLPKLERLHGTGIYRTVTIPKTSYAGLTADVPTIGVENLLVAGPSVDNALAYDITRTLFDQHAELSLVHPEAAKLTLTGAVQGSPLLFHPGAIRLYRERAVWPVTP